MGEIKEYRVFGEVLPTYIPRMMRKMEKIRPFHQEEGVIIYEGSEEDSLKKWMQQEPTREEIREFITAWRQLGQEMEAFFLEKERILSDPETILYDPKTGMVKCAYQPFRDKDPLASFREWNPKATEKLWETETLSRWILETMDWTDPEAIAAWMDLVRNPVIVENVNILMEEEPEETMDIMKEEAEEKRYLPQIMGHGNKETAAGKWLRLKMRLQILWERRLTNKGSVDRDL